LVGLCWLDHRAAIRGLWLAPVLLTFAMLATQELLRLFAAKCLRPIAPVVYLGTALVLLSPWVSAVAPFVNGQAIHSLGELAREALKPILPWEGWSIAALAIAVVLAILGEIARYENPGRVTENLAATVFTIVYLGLLLSFVVRLRLIGMGALASLVIVVKMGDTGAYFCGKAFGRHRMTPRLSPSKTIEGAIGAIVFSSLASWAVFEWLVPITGPSGAVHTGAHASVWGSIAFGVLVGIAGILGDLAESLLKRDAACKDSSSWIPGLGGVLDMLDSVILAAPLAYACWRLGLTG
jgi:phosphatidate cytidylyltransferase